MLRFDVRRTRLAPAVLCAVCFSIAAALATAGSATPPCRGSKCQRDTSPPSITIESPTPGSTVSGTVAVSGTASDDVQVASVEVCVDGADCRLAQETASWGVSVDTTAYPDGSHAFGVRAADSSGNVAAASVSVTVANAPSPPPSDSTPPVVAIASPAAGASLGGTVAVSGTASDDVQLSKIEVCVDGGGCRLAQGTASWTAPVDTTAYSNGSHTLSARAADSSGNVAMATATVTFGNGLPPDVAEQMVTPEGATIQIYSDVSGWTAQRIYDLLRPNAFELSRVGPTLTVKVQTQYSSSTATGVSSVGGVYSNFSATIYLRAVAGTTFTDRPDAIVAHEYGHAWTLYHLYMSQHGDWAPYLEARAIASDPRLDSTYNWSRREMIADDYRMLFGTPLAVSEIGYVNPDVPDPRNVPGLRDFFVGVWAVP